jgi:glucosamine-6-phosphate deaminase
MNMWEWVPIIQPALRDTSRSAFIDRTGIERYHLLDETRDPHQVATEMSREINSAPVHVAFAGMGENGHLAVNGPPADFETQDAYRVVELDEAYRKQQVGEGWFASVEQVPKQAISISIPQLLKAK